MMKAVMYQFKLGRDLMEILDREILSYAGNDEVTVALNELKQKFNAIRFTPEPTKEQKRMTPWRL